MTLFFHYFFMLLSSVGLILLYVSRRSNAFFILLLGVATYIIINYLKNGFGDIFYQTPEFKCTALLVALDYIALYFIPNHRNNRRIETWTILLLLLQCTLAQHLCNLLKMPDWYDIGLEAMPLGSAMIWFITAFALLLSICRYNSILKSGLFFAQLSAFMGITYAAFNDGASIFFTGFAVIIVTTAAIDIYRGFHYDVLENVGSKSAYLKHAASKFPFKYTIAVFSIDNRDKLLQVIGAAKMQTLEQMIIEQIRNMPYSISFYRYNEAELIMVFKNEYVKHTKEFADNIRHNIASSEYIFANRKSLKITISVCVSEKTRKDLNAGEVIERAHSALQKNYRFNCNITTIA